MPNNKKYSPSGYLILDLNEIFLLAQDTGKGNELPVDDLKDSDSLLLIDLMKKGQLDRKPCLVTMSGYYGFVITTSKDIYCELRYNDQFGQPLAGVSLNLSCNSLGVITVEEVYEI